MAADSGWEVKGRSALSGTGPGSLVQDQAVSLGVISVDFAPVGSGHNGLGRWITQLGEMGDRPLEVYHLQAQAKSTLGRLGKLGVAVCSVRPAPERTYRNSSGTRLEPRNTKSVESNPSPARPKIGLLRGNHPPSV